MATFSTPNASITAAATNTETIPLLAASICVLLATLQTIQPGDASRNVLLDISPNPSTALVLCTAQPTTTQIQSQDYANRFATLKPISTPTTLPGLAGRTVPTCQISTLTASPNSARSPARMGCLLSPTAGAVCLLSTAQITHLLASRFPGDAWRSVPSRFLLSSMSQIISAFRCALQANTLITLQWNVYLCVPRALTSTLTITQLLEASVYFCVQSCQPNTIGIPQLANV